MVIRKASPAYVLRDKSSSTHLHKKKKKEYIFSHRRAGLWKSATNHNKIPLKRPPTASEHPTVFVILTLDKNGPRGGTRALVGRQTD